MQRDGLWDEKEQTEFAEEGGHDTKDRQNIGDMPPVVLSQVRLLGSADLLPAMNGQGSTLTSRYL